MAEAQPHSHPIIRALSEHLGHLWIGLDEEGSREDEHVDLILGFLQEGQPHLSGDTGPVLVGADDFGAYPALPWLGLRGGPEEGLLDTQVLSGAETVPGMRNTSAKPAADGFWVYRAGFGERFEGDATLGEYVVKSLVHGGM
ncbi:hypothetical protein Mth01_27500 [Sphaerimonospora thailandensis]|uniref:Uncharacterized protein n=1 Tax=Sphaerimonospora thailandensis TaxID=795644 RepID=A0A8J3RAU4_9ACTN|nr:hypothetical protein Mth01_27500 [Sphaerimonospora thailandensis]